MSTSRWNRQGIAKVIRIHPLGTVNVRHRAATGPPPGRHRPDHLALNIFMIWTRDAKLSRFLLFSPVLRR
ncbi:hypothetical protein EYF80_034070 [Liparis tanakae]|uniref:Uncharacterized protein n=1 Tax=Liparis tanakae TaxID=230148 RepID=A0A4Z2GRG2_9TELE|nr:hypothetical protein EYF80_034070 [Liparis tanakae]